MMNRSDYYLSKLSKDRWQFEDRGDPGSDFCVSFTSKERPSIRFLEEKMRNGGVIEKKYREKIRGLVIQYYKLNYITIRKKMKEELFFDDDLVGDLNRLFPVPGSNHYKEFDEMTLFNLGTIHFLSAEECIVELVVSWDEGVFLKTQDSSISIQHNFDPKTLYGEIDTSNLL